ncbi:MAG: PA2778 family cysteine peptidase [Inhella sp.]
MQRPPGLPARVELSEVPHHAQLEQQCGPAVLAMLLGAIDIPADPLQLAEQVYLPARGGSLQLEMLAGARRAGALACRLPGRLDTLLQELAAGLPVGVLLNLGLSWLPRWHYAVLVGFEFGTDELILRSGDQARARFSFALFERCWARGGHWAIALTRPGHWPATASEAEALQAAIGFERVAPPAQALLAYRSLLVRWPGGLIAELGLGNSLRAAGELNAAAQAYEAAALRHDSAVAWINLAQARRQLGDAAGTRAAAERALARAQRSEPRWLPLAERLLRDSP